MQADEEIGAGAAVAEGVEPALVQHGRALLQARHVLAPRRDGIGLVEADGSRHRLPQALDVRLAEDGARPALVRIGDDRPVAETVGELERCLGELLHPRSPHAVAVEVCQQLGLGVPADRDERRALLAEILRPSDEPRRRPPEVVLARVLDVRAPHVLVGVEHIDVPRARGIRLASHRAHERRVLDERVDPERLAALEV